MQGNDRFVPGKSEVVDRAVQLCQAAGITDVQGGPHGLRDEVDYLVGEAYKHLTRPLPVMNRPQGVDGENWYQYMIGNEVQRADDYNRLIVQPHRTVFGEAMQSGDTRLQENARRLATILDATNAAVAEKLSVPVRTHLREEIDAAA